MPLSIGPTIGVKGEKAFRSAFQEMIAQGSRLKSEMDLLTASFSKNDTAEQRLALTSSNLTRQLQTQERTTDQANQMLVRSMDSIDKTVKLYDAQVKKVNELSQTHAEHTQILNDQIAKYGESAEWVKMAREEWAAEEAELDKANKTLGEREAAVYKQQATTEKWNEVLVTNTTRLEQLRKELVKGADYVEEFGRKSEESKRKVEKHEKALELLDKELEVQLSEYSKLQRYMVENARNRETLIKKIEEEKKVVAENKKLHDEAVKTEEKQRKEYERLVTELEKAKKAYGEDSLEAKRLNDAVEEQAKLVHQAEMNTADYAMAVNDAVLAQRDLEKELQNSTGFATMGKVMSDVGEKMADFGEKMTKYVSTPLAGLGAYAVNAAADFQDAMAKIYTIAIDSTEPMEKMHDELVQLSNDSGFDLSDLSEATYQAVSASVDAGKAVEFMGDATKLARAGFTSTTKAVDLLTTVINAYGMKASDASKISDILLKTQNDGKTVIDDLASSMGIIIPMASNYNVGLDQIAAAYATMTKQGVKTERATTFLRAVFTELEKESSDVAGILEDKTGKSFAQLMGEGKNLSDVLGILYKAVGGNNEEFQRLFGNVRATQAVASLVAEGIGEDAHAFGMFDYELERVRDSAGQVDKALEVMETPALRARKAINRLKNSAENLGETMIDMAAPAFEATVDKVRELTDGFIDMSDSSKKMIVKAGALAAAIGPVTLGIGKLMKYIGGLMLGTASWIPLIGAATAAVMGISTALAISNNEHIEAIRAENDLGLETSEQIEKMNQLQQAHKDFQVSMQERTTATLNEVAYVQELVNQYDSLVNESGKVDDSNKNLANTLLTEIASSLGLTIDDVKALIDEEGKLSTSIQQTITDYQKQAQAAVYQEELLEATRRKTEAERIEKATLEELTQVSELANETARKQSEAQREINDALAAGKPVTQDMIDKLSGATYANKQAQEQVKALRDNLAESQRETEKASEDIEFYKDKLDELNGTAKKTAETIDKEAEKAKTSIKTKGDDAVAHLKGLSTDAYSSGADVARGFANGINDYAYLSSSAASTMGANASKLLNHSVQVKSPSRVTMKTGKYFAQGFALGMEDRFPMVNAMAEKMGTMATDSLAYGSYLPEGAIGGSYSSSKTVNAPISVNVTVNGSVDDPDSFAKDIANRLTNLINRESEVFA